MDLCQMMHIQISEGMFYNQFILLWWASSLSHTLPSNKEPCFCVCPCFSSLWWTSTIVMGLL